MNYIIPVFESENLSTTIQQSAYLDTFSGKKKETALFVDTDGNKHFYLGLGKEHSRSGIINTIRSFFFLNKITLKGDILIKSFSDAEKPYLREICQGAFLGKYEIGYLKNKDEVKPDWYSSGSSITVEAGNEEDLKVGQQLADTQMRIMKWGDAPANYKTPQMLSQWIVESGKECGFEVELFDAKACEEMGMHALLAVGRGSIENPPVFCILKYTHPKATKTVGLVGKGVTFDTGGVSLKPGDNMSYMKSDMGGAAAVAGTIEMAAKLKLPINLIGAIPLTENCIDSYAIKPGDVISSYSGKTIEVINTDAEGRLILADAVAYVCKNYKTDVLIDLATLTGNAIMALGNKAAVLVSPSDSLAEQLFASGLYTTEKVWRMPHWDEYKDSLKSDIADLKNLAGSPKCGAINAAKFIEVFTNNHPEWAHLDIAGTAFDDSEFGSMKSATGYGVRLLIHFLEGLK